MTRVAAGLSLVLLAGPLACSERAERAAPPDAAAAPSKAAAPTLAPDVLATLDGQPIRLDDVSSRTRMEIFRRQVDVHTLLETEVERIVQEKLLEREAARRGVTVDALLEAEVDAKVDGPSADEVDAAMAEQGAPDAARPRVELYLTERARIARRLEFTGGLRRAAALQVHLEPPTPPILGLSLEDAPLRGPEDAPVTLVAFLDWRQAASRSTAADVAKIVRAFPQQVRVAHRAVLRAGDELGLAAALLAERARASGDFWAVHDALLLREDAWKQSDLQEIAEQIGQDIAEIDAARHDPQALLRARSLAQRVLDADVQAPPVVFVNGRRVSGSFGYQKLLEAVQDALHQSTSAPK